MSTHRILVVLVMVFTTFSASLGAVVVHDYLFDKPVVSEHQGEHWVTLAGGITGGTPGAPSLPSFGGRLLLPPGEAAVSVRVVPGEAALFGSGYHVAPSQPHVRLSDSGPQVRVAADPAIYGVNQLYPQVLHSVPLNQGYCGHTIAFFTLNPVQYNPVTGEIWWYPSMRVEIETAPEAQAQERLQALHLRSDRVERTLERWVHNPEEIALYPAEKEDRQEEWDLVVITNAALDSVFQEYVDFKNRRGIRTRMETVEWIYANYTGADNQTEIRDFIIDCYQDWQTQHVLLGGDGDASGAGRIIPYRGVYANVGGEIDTDLPSDLYYGGLDGNWNSDGDGQYGESTPEEADFLAEVHVGRAGVDNVTEAAYFVDKMIAYEQSPVIADCDNVLFCGEMLWDDPNLTFARPCMEEIRWGSSNWGYTTVGVNNPAAADTLYDQYSFYPGEWVANVHLRPKLNAGCNLVNHLGHSNETYNMRFDASDITDANLTNDGVNHQLYVLYSQGCYAGSFDYDDCIMERWTAGIAHGSVAIVGNSRYGWGSYGSTNGLSQYFHRQFVDAVYGEDLTTIAHANDDSKADCLPWIQSDESFRWVALELTVFGDPVLDIWTAQPAALSPSYNGAYVIGVGTFEVDVAGVEGALVACSFGGSLVGRAYTNPSGHATVTLDPAPTTPGSMEVVITAHDYLEHSGWVSVVSPSGAYLIFDSLAINDAGENGNGLADFGETVLLSVTVMNVGIAAAADAHATLSSSDPYVTVTDAAAVYGSIPAGQTRTAVDSFAIAVDDDVPDLHVIYFTLDAAEGDSVWTSHFSLTAHAAVVTIENVVVMDGDNGVLDPGDTADLEVTLHNSGSAAVTNLAAILSSGDPYVTINVSSDNLSSLSGGNSGVVTFNATADAEAPEGHPAEFDLSITADDYFATDDFALALGLSIEDFETGDLYKFPWERSGAASWNLITGANVYEGTYSAKSGAISHNQESVLSVDVEVIGGGEISFYYKVSSESGFDYLRFLVDQNQLGQWSGEQGWVRAAFDVAAGAHTFTWTYSKDGAVVSGSDCAWIDYVVFPPLAPPPEFDLSDPAVSPEVGTTSTSFTFSIVYRSLENNPPVTADVHVDGVPHTMTTSDPNYADGSLFTYATTLSEGEHNYYFRFVGPTLTVRDPASGSYSGPTAGTVVACYDFESGTQGWTVGFTGDNATSGVWGRMDPEPTTSSSGYPVQPGDDHTPTPGVYCFVTDGRAGSGVGSYDVDNGKTTVVSPLWDLSTQSGALLQLWTWYSNDEGGSPSEDYFVVDVSSDGGTNWTNLMNTNANWEYWKDDLFALDDYITLTSQVKLRVVAQDQNSGSLVEAALDDVCLFGVSPQPPAPPSNATAFPEGADIRLRWQASAGATGYRIERALTVGGTYEELITVDGATLEWLHVNGAQTEDCAFYRVIAIR